LLIGRILFVLHGDSGLTAVSHLAAFDRADQAALQVRTSRGYAIGLIKVYRLFAPIGFDSKAISPPHFS